MCKFYRQIYINFAIQTRVKYSIAVQRQLKNMDAGIRLSELSSRYRSVAANREIRRGGVFVDVWMKPATPAHGPGVEGNQQKDIDHQAKHQEQDRHVEQGIVVDQIELGKIL